MLTICSYALAASVTITGMITVSEDLASAYNNSYSFDDGREEPLLYPSSTGLKGWKAGLVWVWSSSIPRGIVMAC